MNICDCGGQRTAEWFAQRIGCLSSSRIADAIGKPKREKTGELQARQDLRFKLAVERLTNKPTSNYVSDWMERGVELEPLARAAYEVRTERSIELVDLVLHDSIKWAACSPDGLCESDGLIEIKVPKPLTHAKYLFGECVPHEYVPQIMWQMACTGRAWCDFVSYCPDFPDPLDLFICRIEADAARILEMESEARAFLAEVDVLESRLRSGLEGALRQSVNGFGQGARSTSEAGT